jgi:DNA-binding HxlR family transcriptional regulator
MRLSCRERATHRWGGSAAEQLGIGSVPSSAIDSGAALAGSASRFRKHPAWTPLGRALAATGDHWTLMIVLQLGSGRMRLSQLHERLPGVSTGVLNRYIGQMADLGLVTRTRVREMPPRVELELTDEGYELVPVAEALTRWGRRHMWSAASEREHVDVDALLQLLPVLLEERTLPDGELEAVVEDAVRPLRHRYRIADGRLRIEDKPGRAAATSIRGPIEAWIAALGPEADHTSLRFSGRTHLAEHVFEALRTGGVGLAAPAAAGGDSAE